MRLLVFSFYCFVASFLGAQEMKEIHVIEGEYNFFRVDNFGKLYLIDGNEIELYSPDAKFLARNSDKFFGEITDVDATNGLEVLVFFKDQLQVVFVDNQLGVKGRDIPLDVLGFDQISNSCTSFANGVWLFDKIKFELIRLDKENRFSARSGNLNQVLGFAVNPIIMRESNNWLYLLDANKGILVFDIYAAYYKTIPITGIDNFQVSADNIIHFKAPHLLSFDMRELQTDTLAKFGRETKQVLIGKNRLNVLSNNKLSIMQYRP